MAILKHIASKNANYGSAIDYLKYQHDEFHLVPVLDENGNMMLRDEFYLEGLNCDPETFDLECELLNQEYNKNNTYDEIKSHHYIISNYFTLFRKSFIFSYGGLFSLNFS